MATPPLDDAARSRGRDRAVLARRRRAHLKADLKKGRVELSEVLASRDDSVIGRLRIGEVIRALPGVGSARAHRVLSTCDVDPSRRLGQLGEHQVARLIEMIRGAPAKGHSARLIVLSGPSGVGKSSVVSYLRTHHPRIWFSISVTTRSPRPGEVDGVDYHFVDQVEFDRLRDAGELLEWAVFAGNSYGTPAEPVRQRLARGEPVMCEIELQGARQVRVKDPNAVLVFLAPPSWDELVKRLTGRGTEGPEVVAERLSTARRELAAESEFDVVVVNDSIAQAAEEILGLVTG